MRSYKAVCRWEMASGAESVLPKRTYDFLFKFLLIGDSSAGKTKLLLRYISDTLYTSSINTTIGVDFKIKTIELRGKRIKLQIWNTAGQERFRTITTTYYRGTVGIILVYDITNQQSFDNITMFLREIEMNASEDVKMILIGNKCHKEAKRVVPRDRGEELARSQGIPFLETSAKTNYNVDEAFELLTELVLEKKMARCILLKDKSAEKAGTWFGVAKRVMSKNVLKGELLIAIPEDKLKLKIDQKRSRNYQLVNDETITVRVETDDIAPLSDREFQLLVAIDSPLARYKVFSSNEMKWGLGLKPGSAVNVTIQGNVHVRAVVRCVVDVAKHSGLLYGVQIMDISYLGRGTTDGTWKGKRYFSCKENCGLFVALDQLSHRMQEQSTHTQSGTQAQGSIHTQGSTHAHTQESTHAHTQGSTLAKGNTLAQGNTLLAQGPLPQESTNAHAQESTLPQASTNAHAQESTLPQASTNAHAQESTLPQASTNAHAQESTRAQEQKQQILLLQQQVFQQTTLQQKQDQDQATAPGQQTAPMQLLPQQQGLFSHQQAQLEKLNQAGEDHRRELQEAEVKYKETIPVQQQQNLILQNQLAQQSQELQRSQQRLQALVQTLQLQLQQCNTQIQERDRQLLKRIQEQHLLHEEKHHLEEECTTLQQQVVRQREAAEQQSSLLKQQLSQQSQLSQKVSDELECQLQNMSEQNKKIEEEQHILLEEKHHLQEECTVLQQQVVRQREAAVQAEVQYRQEIEDLQSRLDTALAEMQQLRPSSRTQVLVGDIDPWKVSRDEVQILSEIDRGAWGGVTKGKFRGQLVAVKSPHLQILNRHTTERLQREVRIMTQVRHPNLLRIIAAVFDNQVPRLPPLIVTELLDMNLRAAYQNNVLSGTSRIPIFRDVAYALHYLHEHQEPIIHRDVSAPNILLEELPNGMFKAKVSDFGSANLAKLAQTLAEGAIIYAAPETFPPRDLHSRPPPQTTKIDVYSYGILLCEVITCQLPDPQRFWIMLQEVQRNWTFMYDLIVSCTHNSPEDRLTMAQVLDKLNQLPRARPRQRS